MKKLLPSFVLNALSTDLTATITRNASIENVDSFQSHLSEQNAPLRAKAAEQLGLSESLPFGPNARIETNDEIIIVEAGKTRKEEGVTFPIIESVAFSTVSTRAYESANAPGRVFVANAFSTKALADSATISIRKVVADDVRADVAIASSAWGHADGLEFVNAATGFNIQANRQNLALVSGDKLIVINPLFNFDENRKPVSLKAVTIYEIIVH